MGKGVSKLCKTTQWPYRTFSSTSALSAKLIQFTYKCAPGATRAGYTDGCTVVDINLADPCMPVTMLEILQKGTLHKVKRMQTENHTAKAVPFCNVNLVAPIHGMDKVLGVMTNYRDHCTCHGIKEPKVPTFFSKFASCIVGPCEPLLIRTEVACEVDWEVELCVVISRVASGVRAAFAFEYVLGLTVAQDISARDWRAQNGEQLTITKSMDTFLPLGPWIVPLEEISDPHNLGIMCGVNGVLKQNSNTCMMIHKIPFLIERITSVMTLLPGDLILTGTPAGVGQYSKPPEFLKPGDMICSDIQEIGALATLVCKHSNNLN